jgi:hypothetical protein
MPSALAVFVWTFLVLKGFAALLFQHLLHFVIAADVVHIAAACIEELVLR